MVLLKEFFNLKAEKLTNLLVDTLRDLLEIKVEGPAFDDFKPQLTVELCWSNCKTTRRSNQLPRKEYRPLEDSNSTRKPSTSRVTDSAEAEHSSDSKGTTIFSLEEWDSWFKDQQSDSRENDEHEIVVLHS